MTMTKKTMIPYDEAAKEWRKKPGYQRAFDALTPEYALYEALLKAMKESDLTQKEIAKRMHTSEAAVSRLFDSEKKHAPNWSTIMKFAHAIGKTPVLTFADAQP